ncbi:MAG: hypothetical protein U9Q07_10960 [Planctomycetota bacterium]|nr:hypothetical protein [Planctomycetota bacterium]
MKQTFLAYLLVSVVFGSVCAAEFQINTHTTYDQKNAAIAMDQAGGFVVVWSSYLQDGSSNGIFAQRFDPNCSPIGEESQINVTSSGNQAEPAVATDAAAGFVVTWHGPAPVEQDREDIFARRFDPNGGPLGDEFLVNSNTSDRQLYPSAALNNDGTFVVVWESVDFGADGDKAICGQLYDSNGVVLGSEFVVSGEPSVCRYANVAADANGNFAVVWLDDAGSNSIMARLFDPNGLPRTQAFEVNTVRFGSVTRPSIAMDSAGYFAVTWDGDPDLARLDDIHARVFEPNGAPLGDQLLVNATIDGPQGHPQIAMSERAEFVIVWESRIDPDVNERDIFVQRFDNFGEPLGAEFQVNTYSEGDQRYPVATLGGDGRFVIAWQSYAQDGSRYGIFAETGRMVGSADFNDDGFVDFADYCIFADQWLEEVTNLPADLIYDNRVDVQDLAEFSRQWLTQLQ